MTKILVPATLIVMALLFSLLGTALSSFGFPFATFAPYGNGFMGQFVWPFLTNALLVFLVVATPLWLMRRKLWMSSVGRRSATAAAFAYFLIPLSVLLMGSEHFWQPIFAFNDPHLENVANSAVDAMMTRAQNGDMSALPDVCNAYGKGDKAFQMPVRKYNLDLVAYVPVEVYEREAGMKLCYDFLNKKYAGQGTNDRTSFKGGFEKILVARARARLAEIDADVSDNTTKIANGLPASDGQQRWDKERKIIELVDEWGSRIYSVRVRSIIYKEAFFKEGQGARYDLDVVLDHFGSSRDAEDAARRVAELFYEDIGKIDPKRNSFELNLEVVSLERLDGLGKVVFHPMGSAKYRSQDRKMVFTSLDRIITIYLP